MNKIKSSSTKATSVKKECIVLNKPFVGEYLDDPNHNAHELINFFLADDGNYYIYNNPYGQNVSGAENYDIKYVFFTTNSTAKKFVIMYKAEIEKQLHTESISRVNIGNEQVYKEFVAKAKEQIEQELGKSLQNVTYGGMQIDRLFDDQTNTVPFTYKAKALYKAKVDESMLINISSSVFNYNFQRNFGYVTSTKAPKSYYLLKNLAEDDTLWEKVPLKKFKFLCKCKYKEKFKCIDNADFLSLISFYKKEECYTKMIANTLRQDQNLTKKFVEACFDKCRKSTDFSGEEFTVYDEYSIKKVGKLDILIESDNYRLVIENKIDSNISHYGSTPPTDQLNKYYDYFEKFADKKETIYIVLAPNYRITDLEIEIKALPSNIYDKWQIWGYNFVYEFYKANKALLKKSPYRRLYDNIVSALLRQSLSRQELFELRLSQKK